MKLHNDILQLTPLTIADIPSLIRLSASIGWDYDEAEICTMLQSGTIFGHKTEDGTVVSSAAIIPYENGLASIGMVIVHEQYRGRSLGKIVTQACIDTVSSDTTIMLIATEQGIPLYEQIGFKAVDSVLKYICDNDLSITMKSSNETIHFYHHEDFPQIVQLDEAAVGANRTEFLKHRLNQSKECLVVKDLLGKIIGFGLSIQGSVNCILGPIVAPSEEIALLLIDQLAKSNKGPFRMDVPANHVHFGEKLTTHGFKLATHPPIMILNGEHLPHRNNKLFGIAAQAFG